MKTVLITGGSRGIGAEMVRRFARGGFSVVFLYHRSRDAATKLAKETGAIPLVADVGCESDVYAAVQKALDVLGHIDVLINNAAVAGFRLFTDICTEEWERMFAVNVHGAFFCTKAVLPGMISRKTGTILNISSMWGQVGASCEVHYSTTKAALIGMTRALAKEVGPSGITVNCIAPGVIDTDMNQMLGEEDRCALREETPLGRFGTPAEVAEAAYFLAGEHARFITGQVWGINGGFVI